MSDNDILDLFNATIEAQERLAAEYDLTLIDITPGRPQIYFHEGSEEWVPRRDVVRCYFEDDEAGEVVVYVDDRGARSAPAAGERHRHGISGSCK